MRFVLIPYTLYKEVFTKIEVKNDLVSGQLKTKKTKKQIAETASEKFENPDGENEKSSKKR